MSVSGWRLMRWGRAIGAGAMALTIAHGVADAARPRASAQSREPITAPREAPSTIVARVQVMDGALSALETVPPSVDSDAPDPASAHRSTAVSAAAPHPSSATGRSSAAAWGLLLLGGALGGLAGGGATWWRMRRRRQALQAVIRLREQQLSEAREQLALAARQRDEANWYLGEARAAR